MAGQRYRARSDGRQKLGDSLPKPFDTSSASMQLGEQDLVGWSRLSVSDAAHIVCNAGTAMKCHETPTNE